MIKTMCCLGSATLGVLLLSACGSTTPLTVDKSVLSTGDTNGLSTGGYWWTYSDHNAQESTGNASATIVPQTNLDIPMVPVADDAAHGKVIYASGSVPVAPAWADVTNMGLAGGANWSDKYWKKLYPDALIAGYPAAGIGFGFQKNNKPFDVTQSKYIGFVFEMKTSKGTNDISVSVPIVGTDMPDSNFSDEFPKECVYPNQKDPAASDSVNFLATYATQSCFRNYRKMFAMAERAADDTWQTYCVLWSELGPPSWGASATPPPIDKTSLKRTLKVQWDMFQPQTGTAVVFDVKLDNVKMVTEADANKVTACDTAAIAASALMLQ